MYFLGEKCIRQGNSLSALLYIFDAESMALATRRPDKEGIWTSVEWYELKIRTIIA